MPLAVPALVALSAVLSCPGAAAQAAAQTAAQTAACAAAPHGATTLFLRGGMNGWGSFDNYAFTYKCDAYYLNVNSLGLQEFKIADAAWSVPLTFGAPDQHLLRADTPAPLGHGGDAAAPGNIKFKFSGEHTVRLAFPAGRAELSIGAKTFPDDEGGSLTDKIALSLRHDTRALADKAPFGSAGAGTEIAFALNGLPGATGATLVIEKRRLEGNQEVLEYTEVARVPMTPARSGGSERWSAKHRFADPAIYGYYFEVQSGGATYIYQNNRNAVYWTREQGTNGLGLVGRAGARVNAIRRFRQTIHAGDFRVPGWARDAVYYYIFPDRFRNGDKRNDPTPGRSRYQDKDVEFHANWLDKPYRPGSGDGSDAHVNNDFFGGDLRGVIDKLDYIKALGANTIYMTPLFRATSNHKYDTGDYRNIDPGFGSNADYTRLVKEAAKRGIRLIADASFNHTGSDSIYFDRYAKYPAKGAFEAGKIAPDSPYASWYSFAPGQAEPEKSYKGWSGVADLPELDKSARSWRDFAYGAPDSVTRLWLARGAAGWRMDVAPWVPDDFWREWRKVVKSERPDALTIAETWFDSSKYFLGDTFDTTMNYIFRNAVLDYAGGMDARIAYRNIELMREAYPPQAFYALMNLLSTHDQARSLHVLGDVGGDPASLALAKRRMRMAVFFQMMFPGAPAVYYGDEVGLSGGDDPANRAGYPWADLGGKPDLALLAAFKALIRMRDKFPVLRHGSIDAPLLLDEHVLVLARRDGANWALTATNNDGHARSVNVTLPAGAPTSFTDALSGKPVRAVGGRIRMTVPALYGTVLVGRAK
ncbi:glycoside hydrolase family 13 protein [Massilia glaciei]|nr:glycoside hydrolase family 13 protein [Massilia glaciei]